MDRVIINQINDQLARYLISFAGLPKRDRRIAAERLYGFAAYVLKWSEIILSMEVDSRYRAQTIDRLKLDSRRTAIEDFNALSEGVKHGTQARYTASR